MRWAGRGVQGPEFVQEPHQVLEGQRLLVDPGYSREFASRMYWFAVQHGYSSAEWWFEDAFDQAEEGVYGRVEDLQVSVLGLVKQTIEREGEKT